MIMPNTRVRLGSALIGAFVAGILWEVSKWSYGLYVSSASMYRTLYGPLVAIPLLYLWIQLSWIIVLFGALLTFAQDAADDFRLEEGAVTASARERLKAALRCMIAVGQAHYRGHAAPNVSALAARLRIPVRLVRAATGDLLAGGLLHEIVRLRDRGEGGLVPARDLQTLTVYDVLACLQGAGTSSSPARETLEAREAERVLAQLDASLQQVGGPLSFASIIAKLDQARSGEPPAPELVEFTRPR